MSFAFLAPVQAKAFVHLDGFFIALDVCEGMQSFARGTNPGMHKTEKMRVYPMRGMNKRSGSHYLVDFGEVRDGARDRWVKASCGKHVTSLAEIDLARTQGKAPVKAPSTPESTENLLVLSWQPSFCETYRGRGKAECQAINQGRSVPSTRQLSLHGLWPQPNIESRKYCGVDAATIEEDTPSRDGTWDRLPPVELSDETGQTLDVMMPGRQSGLDRHEWVKHGTCYHDEDGPEGYYKDSLELTLQINSSELGGFIAENVGQKVQAFVLWENIDASFGAGASDAVRITCHEDGERTVLDELWFGLEGKITANTTAAELLHASDYDGKGATHRDCLGLLTIDPPALQ